MTNEKIYNTTIDFYSYPFKKTSSNKSYGIYQKLWDADLGGFHGFFYEHYLYNHFKIPL